jgi:long-subunit fatty acid transport protein
VLARTGGVLLALLSLDAPTASAQAIAFLFNRIGSGARAAGMANAFVAISDDGTAASWNPAGLGQLRKPELSIVTSTAGRSSRAEGFRSRDDSVSYSPYNSSYYATDLDFASLAVPLTLFGKPVTFQGAWRRLYTLDYREVVSTTREPLAAQGPPAVRIDANSDTVGAVDLISLAGAVKLTSRVAVGASFNLWRGDWTGAVDVVETPLAGPDLPASGSLRETNRVRGESFSLGVLLTYPRWNVGLLYQSPLHSDFSGTAGTVHSGVAPAPPISAAGTLRFPQAIGLGIAWRPAQRWTTALDLTWDDWDAATLDLAGSPAPVNFFDGQPQDRTSTRDTLSVNAGAERLFVGDAFVIPLRFGVGWEPQGARSPYTRDPVDFTMIALGSGYNTNSIKFDAAFQFRWAHYHDGAEFWIHPGDPLLPSAVGDRTVKDWRIKLSVILRLTDTEKLGRTVRKVFGGA